MLYYFDISNKLPKNYISNCFICWKQVHQPVIKTMWICEDSFQTGKGKKPEKILNFGEKTGKYPDLGEKTGKYSDFT